MITFEVFAVVIASVAGVYAAANIYVKFSLRSYRLADAMLIRMDENLDRLADSGAPIGAARVGFMLTASAGCGCYVRGVLYSFYMPSALARLIAGGPRRESAVEHDLFDLDKLNSEQRKIFSELIASVIIYDGFRNPLSGWALRHAMKSYKVQSFTERADAEATAVSILSRKKPEKLPALARELCNAA